MKTGELEHLLSLYGHVSDIHIRHGPDKCCSAIARYERPEQAQNAMQMLDNRTFGGLKLAVKLERSEPGLKLGFKSPPKDLDSDSNSSRSIWGQAISSNSGHDCAQLPADSSQKHIRNGPLIVDGAGGDMRRRRVPRRRSDSDSESDSN